MSQERREVIRDDYNIKRYEIIQLEGETSIFHYSAGRFLDGEELIRVLQTLQEPKDEARIRA